MRIGSELNAHRERSHVANWMRITWLLNSSKSYTRLSLAFHNAFVALNIHIAKLVVYQAPRVYLRAPTRQSQFGSNPVPIYLPRWIETNAHWICIERKRIHMNASEPDWMRIQSTLQGPCERALNVQAAFGCHVNSHCWLHIQVRTHALFECSPSSSLSPCRSLSLSVDSQWKNGQRKNGQWKNGQIHNGQRKNMISCSKVSILVYETMLYIGLYM